jgi:hypothetical protein
MSPPTRKIRGSPPPCRPHDKSPELKSFVLLPLDLQNAEKLNDFWGVLLHLLDLPDAGLLLRVLIAVF